MCLAFRKRSRLRFRISAWNRSKSVVGSSASEGCADENTIVPPDASIAGATLGAHHSAPEEPLMRATQRVHGRRRTHREGDSCRCLPVDIPGRDPRFDARDSYATTSPSSDSAGLRLAALADCPFDVMLTSIEVRAVTSKMYTSWSLFLIRRVERGERFERDVTPVRTHRGRGAGDHSCALSTPPLASTVMPWRTSRTYTSATVFVSAEASRAVETKATTAPSRLTRGE